MKLYYIERGNSIAEDSSVKVFLGICLAVFFPFAAKAIMEYTGAPIVSAALYWLIFGLILKMIVSKRFPYFNIQFNKIWIETIALLIVDAVAFYIYIRESAISFGSIKINQDILINLIIFAVLDGIFEQIVWINIYELFGNKFKVVGLLFSVGFVTLMYLLFWSKFIPMPGNNIQLFILLQILLYALPFAIYIKTRDLTIWTIQHILYNIIIVLIGNFGFSVFLHIGK